LLPSNLEYWEKLNEEAIQGKKGIYANLKNKDEEDEEGYY